MGRFSIKSTYYMNDTLLVHKCLFFSNTYLGLEQLVRTQMSFFWHLFKIVLCLLRIVPCPFFLNLFRILLCLDEKLSYYFLSLLHNLILVFNLQGGCVLIFLLSQSLRTLFVLTTDMHGIWCRCVGRLSCLTWIINVYILYGTQPHTIATYYCLCCFGF